jgi:hypothetical protein
MSPISRKTSADTAPHGHCPYCRGPLFKFGPEQVKTLGLPDDDALAILGCGACQRLTGHVDGIQDVWRVADGPAAVDRVIQDAWDGLRQRHFLMVSAR